MAAKADARDEAEDRRELHKSPADAKEDEMATVSVNPPRTPVTKGSNGIAAATLPNVCKMPGPPAPFVPTPLPNIGKSGDSPKGYSKRVKIEGHTVAIRGASFGSVGDIASKGTGGGIVSNNTHGPTKFIGPGSLDVKIEGKNVHYLGDPMMNNCGPSGSPANSATMVGVLQATGMLAALWGDEPCALCGESHGDSARLEESEDTKGDADKLKKAADVAVEKAKPEREKMLEPLREAELRKCEEARAALAKKMDGMRGKAPQDVIANEEAKLTALVPRNVDSLVRLANITAMLGVVRCQHGQTFAGKSGSQYKELQDAAPAGWHTPFASLSLLEKKADFSENREAFLRRIGEDRRKAFRKGWQEAEEARASAKETGIPAYPPGHCAAQQVVLLALNHGCRPIGLTERAYSSCNPEYKVKALVRDISPKAEPRLRAFGGKEAVPPCKSCEIILTMLICPKDRPRRCSPCTPEAEVCRCTPEKP